MLNHQIEIFKLIEANVLPQPFEIRQGLPHWNNEGLADFYGCSLCVADAMFGEFMERIPALAEIMRRDPSVFCVGIE